MRKAIGSVFPALFFLLLVVPRLSALEVPPHPDGYVTDRAGILSPSKKAELEAVLRAFEEKTSSQIVIAAFPSLEGDSLGDFSMHLAEAWKAGQKGKDNGVIFLIFRDDRKMRIEVGYGLEGVLTDAIAGQIISQVVAPYFRRGDYEGGVGAGADAIMKATQGEFKGVSGEGRSNAAAHLFVLFGLLFFLHFLARANAGRIGSRGGRHGGYFPMGGGFRSGGGRFGGFRGGGGSFGGGGASGGW